MDVRLEVATKEDLPLIMAWRSSPLVYEGFYSQNAPLVWDEHVRWFRSRNRDWRTFIIHYNDRPVGILNIGQLDHWSPELGYAIGEVTLWGKGVGRQAVKLALDWLKDYGKQYCHTTVLKKNERSVRLLKSLGFDYMAEAREGEIWMSRKL